MKHQEQGFTLIELVVVMLISIILMGIAGSLLLVSTTQYHGIIATDADKQSLDAIADLLRSELLYATELELSEEPKTEDGWKYFYISDGAEGRLYLNQTEDFLYGETFYHHRSLRVATKGYEGDRMDLTLRYLNQEDEEVYQNKQTIVFPNLSIQKDKGVNVMEDAQLDNEVNGYYIYYRRDDLKEAPAYGGTVADQLACKEQEGARDLGLFDAITDRNEIGQGDFVYILNDAGEQQWYRFMPEHANSFSKPGSNDGLWKRIISDEFVAGSVYLRGDIVSYPDEKQRYFIYTFDKPLDKAGGDKNITTNQTGYFNPVYPNSYKEPYCGVQENGDGLQYTYVIGSPYAKLYEQGIIPEQASFTKHTSSTMIRSVKNQAFTASDVVEDEHHELWINLSSGARGANEAGKETNGTLSWQKLQVMWDSNSAYEKGDIVMIGNDTYIALEDITQAPTQKPSDYKYKAGPWKWVRYDPQTNQWTQRYS